MTLTIRPHHLLCMLTYLGKGYTPDFVINYGRIVKRLNAGEEISIVHGPDDICGPMLGEDSCHCHNASVYERDRLAAMAIAEILDISLSEGRRFRLNRHQVATMRDAFASGGLRTACQGCEWFDLCSGIARNNFRGCLSAPPE